MYSESIAGYIVVNIYVCIHVYTACAHIVTVICMYIMHTYVLCI